MKIFAFAAVAFILQAHAQDNLIIKENVIHTIASFDHVDYLSTLAHDGTFLWEIPFQTKILTIKESDTHLYVFSCTRKGAAYFISCVDKEMGNMDWEKVIYPPQDFPPNPTPEEVENLPLDNLYEDVIKTESD